MRVRIVAGAAALVAAAGTAVAVQVAGAGAAHAALVVVQQVTGPVSANDSQPVKTARATCPAGTRVIGGGGWVLPAVTADATRVVLTELQPVHPARAADFYEATGEEAIPNITTNWAVQAFAMCVDRHNTWIQPHIASNGSNVGALGSSTICGPGEVVIGGGGQVNNGAGHVALSGVFPVEINQFDAVRWDADVSSDTSGYSDWDVTSYAVCTPSPPGYQIAFAPSTQPPTASTKVGLVNCPAGTHLLSPAGTTTTRNQNLGLQVIFPSPGLDQAEASAVTTVPTTADWGVVNAVAICAA